MGGKLSGRKSMAVEVGRFLKGQGKKSLDIIVALRDDKKNSATVRLDAARYVFDQLYGRAGQRVDMDVTSGGEPMQSTVFVMPDGVKFKIKDLKDKNANCDSEGNQTSAGPSESSC